MNKKDLKMYEAPASEVVELNAPYVLQAASPDPKNPFDGNTADTPEIE